MKVCAYCGSHNEDNTKTCSKCNATEFQNVCNNCHTTFKTGFCPSCGTRAGEQPKICPNCGVKTFSPFCPTCGSSLGANGGTRSMPQPQAPTYIVVNQQPQQKIEVLPPPPKSNKKMVILTIFFPFVTAWIILFSSKYDKGMRIFALIWSGFMTVACITSGTIPGVPFCIAPLIGYGIKVLIDRKKAKQAAIEAAPVE